MFPKKTTDATNSGELPRKNMTMHKYPIPDTFALFNSYPMGNQMLSSDRFDTSIDAPQRSYQVQEQQEFSNFLSPPPSKPPPRMTPGEGKEKYAHNHQSSPSYSLWGPQYTALYSSLKSCSDENVSSKLYNNEDAYYSRFEQPSNSNETLYSSSTRPVQVDSPYFHEISRESTSMPSVSVHQHFQMNANYPFAQHAVNPTPSTNNSVPFSLFVPTALNSQPFARNTNNNQNTGNYSHYSENHHHLPSESLPVPNLGNAKLFSNNAGLIHHTATRSSSNSPPHDPKARKSTSSQNQTQQQGGAQTQAQLLHLNNLSSLKDIDQSQYRSDPLDSPTSNLKFKQFYRGFKQKEKEGYEEAKAYAIEHFAILPEKIHWRIYLELADLAKRENHIQEARDYYKEVNVLQPTAAQGWLEYAKMEEESGNLNECKKILKKGLEYCPVNESLMVKCLKHYERMDHLDEARQLLGELKDVPIDRTWRTIMEGGLLEARQGNTDVARQVFKFLIKSVPWYGPIYQEACRFEEKCEEHAHAMNFVQKGLEANPRYGPLWFSALRLNEKLAKEQTDNMSIHHTIENAIKSISKELIWKLYFEAAQIEERLGDLNQSREYYVKSVSHCPDNLLWKVWMGGARTELNYGNIETARKLLKRALKEVPPKMKAMVLLECSRLEEYALKLDKAREILEKAKRYTKHEWKVFLESVLLEIRANNLQKAIDEAQQALEIHTGTGRLWAVMIQLKQAEGHEQQMEFFKKALSEVPKSGEVWCEGARIAIQQGDFASARKYINFAIQFTPQYGDSFIEYLRLEILEKREKADLAFVEQACVNADPNYGALWLHCKKNPLDSTRNVVREAIHLLTTPQPGVECPASSALSVNQIYQNIHERSEEERRKAIFL